MRGRKPVTIPIHGNLLKSYIRGTYSSMEEFAKAVGVTRMSVHTWVSSGRIPPRKLCDTVKLLNLNADDVQLLERKEATVVEKRLDRLRECETALADIRKILTSAGVIQ